MIGFGSASLNKFNDKQKVETVSQEVAANLRLARNYAVTEQLPEGANKVTATIDSEGFINIRSQNAVGGILTSYSRKDITPNGVTVVFHTTDVADSSTIKFGVTDGRLIDKNLNSVTAVVTITGNDGYTKTINIVESGLIYEQ